MNKEGNNNIFWELYNNGNMIVKLPTINLNKRQHTYHKTLITSANDKLMAFILMPGFSSSNWIDFNYLLEDC